VCGTVLLGPIQATVYLLNHGFMAVVLGAMWWGQCPWWLTLPMGTLVRLGGTLAYIALSSWTLNENLFVLVLGNVYSLVVRRSLSFLALELVGISSFRPTSCCK
jgi:hypothetical protein